MNSGKWCPSVVAVFDVMLEYIVDDGECPPMEPGKVNTWQKNCMACKLSTGELKKCWFGYCVEVVKTETARCK